jgi:integrase
MRGSTLYQVNTLFEEIKAFGQSKYQAKQAFAREAGSKGLIYNAQNLTERTGVYSYASADTYRKEWRQCLQFSKDHFGIKDIEKINGDIVKAYISDKIDRTGGNKNTIGKTCSAMVKMAVALDKLHKNDIDSPNRHVDDFRRGIAEAKQGRTLERPEQARAYQNPQALKECLNQEVHKVASELIAETGVRATEASLITPNQLNEHNHFSYQSKGGQDNIRTLSSELADRIRGYFEKDGAFKINQNDYRADLKQAAFASGQEYHGIHGLRWNYAQENYEDFRSQGLTHYEACKETSELMGHHRPDITELYLRRE